MNDDEFDRLDRVATILIFVAVLLAGVLPMAWAIFGAIVRAVMSR